MAWKNIHCFCLRSTRNAGLRDHGVNELPVSLVAHVRDLTFIKSHLNLATERLHEGSGFVTIACKWDEAPLTVTAQYLLVPARYLTRTDVATAQRRAAWRVSAAWNTPESSADVFGCLGDTVSFLVRTIQHTDSLGLSIHHRARRKPCIDKWLVPYLYLY